MIVLVGFMGAGKSTVGRLLAAELGLPFSDTDAEIERRTGRGIPEIFRTDGEPGFRDLEEAVVADVLAGRGGGGVPRGRGLRPAGHPRPAARAHRRPPRRLPRRRSANAPAATPAARCCSATTSRSCTATRRAVFTALADVEVATDGRTADDVAAALLDALAARGVPRRAAPTTHGAPSGAPQPPGETA